MTMTAALCPPWCTVRDHMDFTGSPGIHSAWHTIDLTLHPVPEEDGTTCYEDVKAGLDIDPEQAGGRVHVCVTPLDSAEFTFRMTLAEAEQVAASLLYWVATARAAQDGQP
jgi:hypothetical protein